MSEVTVDADPGDETVEAPVEFHSGVDETSAGAPAPSPTGFAVFEAHAASWFQTAEAAAAHAAELVAHRPAGDAGPVVAKTV
jgi:hypothetical protein